MLHPYCLPSNGSSMALGSCAHAQALLSVMGVAKVAILHEHAQIIQQNGILL